MFNSACFYVPVYIVPAFDYFVILVLANLASHHYVCTCLCKVYAFSHSKQGLDVVKLVSIEKDCG